MTQSSRHASDFALHLDSRLDQLAAAECDEPFRDFLRRWIAGVRDDIREYCDADRYTLPDPQALVYLGGEDHHGPAHRYHLQSNIVCDQVIRYELDLTLTPGSTVQLTDVGDYPVNLRCRVVVGYTIHNAPRNHAARAPIARPILFQANVHCPDCQQFGCHRVSIPLTPWAGFIWRHCGCGHNWRQHPQEV